VIIQAGGNKLHSKTYKLIILFVIRKNCHSSGRNLPLNLFIKWVIKLT